MDFDCPSSSLCQQQLLQKAAEVAPALLLQSQLLSAGGAERNGGSTGCARQSQPLPTGDGVWSKRSPYKNKKKSLHIYKCQNKYLRQTPPPLKHVRNHTADCSQDSLQGLREKSSDYTTGQPARLPSHYLMPLKPATHWEGGGRASKAEHQHATVLERNVMV